MSSKIQLGWVAVFGLSLLAVAKPAPAAPIVYTASGIITSGVFGGTAFNDALVTVTGIGDTDAPVTTNFIAPFTFDELHPLTSQTISVAGLGQATVTTPGFLVVSYGPAGFSSSAFQAYLASSGGLAILGAQSYGSFAGWNGRTSIGPISEFGSWLGTTVGTSAGDFMITSNLNTTIFTATVVPEASAFGSAGLGFLLLTYVVRARRG